MNKKLIKVTFKPQYFVVDMDDEELNSSQKIIQHLQIENSYFEENLFVDDLLYLDPIGNHLVNNVSVQGIDDCVNYSGMFDDVILMLNDKLTPTKKVK